MELAERVAMTKEGQVTWADPDIGRKCWECLHAHNKWPRAPNRKTHICSMVRLVSGRTGKPFDAQRAIACSKFKGVDIEMSAV